MAHQNVIREIDYFLAWLVFFLCVTLGGGIIGGICGAIMGFAFAAAGVPIESIRVYGMILGFIISLPISYITFRLVVAGLIVKKFENASQVPDQFSGMSAPYTRPGSDQPYAPPQNR